MFSGTGTLDARESAPSCGEKYPNIDFSLSLIDDVMFEKVFFVVFVFTEAKNVDVCFRDEASVCLMLLYVEDILVAIVFVVLFMEDVIALLARVMVLPEEVTVSIVFLFD